MSNGCGAVTAILRAFRALARYQEATQCGLADGSNEFHFSHPTNLLVIQNVARELGVLAEKHEGWATDSVRQRRNLGEALDVVGDACRHGGGVSLKQAARRNHRR